MNMPFVREQGVGPGVVCFHSNCSSSGQFKELMDTLGSHFHVLAFDAYGAGKTPAWSRSTYLSLSDEVALAEAVMLRAGERVILVGHSYGAAALKLCIKRFRPWGTRAAAQPSTALQKIGARS